MNSGGEEEKIEGDDNNDKFDLKENNLEWDKTEDSTEDIKLESFNLEDFEIIDEVDGDIGLVKSKLQDTNYQSDETNLKGEKEGTVKLEKNVKSKASSETDTKHRKKASTHGTTNKSNISRKLKSGIIVKVHEPNMSKSLKSIIKRESKKCSVFNRISYPPLTNDAMQHTLDKTFEYDLARGPIWHGDNSYNIRNGKNFQHTTSKEDCQVVSPVAKKSISTCEKPAVVVCESDVKALSMVESAELELLRHQLYEKAKLFYKDGLQNILKLHKNRRQNNIVIVTDERSKIDLSIFGKAVSVVVIPDLKLSRCNAAIKLLPNFGKGTIFIFACGTHDLLLSVPSQSCINCEGCKGALNQFKLPSNCEDFQLIIKHVLQLNMDILNSTKNDVAIFCGLFPVNINQENDIRYQNRKCELIHDDASLQIVETTSYEKYYNTIYCFNKFANDHAEILGYKQWNFDNFKLFEQKRHQYLFIEGLYTVSSFEQENIEKEIKIKCIELHKSLVRPLIQENLELHRDGIANSVVKLTGNVEVDLKRVVNAQKGRTQSNIAIISDDRESFDTYLTGFDSRISVAKIKHLNFENVFASMRTNPKFGKGTIFVVSCGTHDLLQFTPVLDCISCDCLNPVMELSLNPFSIDLIKEAFKLNVKLINCTTNDIVLFSELFPVNIKQYRKYHSRQCNHPLEAHPNITEIEFKKYLADIKLYNSFVTYHAQSLSFMPWDLVSPFSEGDLSRILIADGYNIRESEELRRCEVAKLRCLELIPDLTQPSHAVGSKFKNLNAVNTIHLGINQMSDENCEKRPKYDHIILVTHRGCMPYIKHFRKRSVSFLIIDKGLAIEDLGKFISERQNILTPKTLYFLVISIHYVTKNDSAKACLENKCHNALQRTIDNVSERTAQSDFIKHLTKSLHDSLIMGKSYLPLSSDMAILPALPVSYINLSDDHESMHEMTELFPDYLLCDPKGVTTYEKWVQYLSYMSVASINDCIKKDCAEKIKKISAVNYLEEMKGLPNDKPNLDTWKECIQEIINDAFTTLLPYKIKNSDTNEEEPFLSFHRPTQKNLSQEMNPLFYSKRNADIVPLTLPSIINETMMLPSRIVGYIIGQLTENIRNISKISGAKMYVDQFSNKPNFEKPLVITGEPIKVEMAKKLVEEQLFKQGINLTGLKIGNQIEKIGERKHKLGSKPAWLTSQRENCTGEKRSVRKEVQYERGNLQKIEPMERECPKERENGTTVFGVPNAPPGMPINAKLMKTLSDDQDSCDYSYPIIQESGDIKSSQYPQESRLVDLHLYSGTTSNKHTDPLTRYSESESRSSSLVRQSQISSLPNIESSSWSEQVKESSQLFSSRYKRSNESFDYFLNSTEQNAWPGEQSATSTYNSSKSQAATHRSIAPKHNREGSRGCSSTRNKTQELSSTSYNKISNSRSPEASRSKCLRYSRSRSLKRSSSRPLKRSRSRSSKRSQRSRPLKRSKRSSSLKRSKRPEAFRRSRSRSLKCHKSRSRSLKSIESSKYLHDHDKSNFSLNDSHDQGNSQKTVIHRRNEEKCTEYCKKLPSDYYATKSTGINLDIKEKSITARQALKVDDTKLRNQLSPELFDKYKESLLKLQHSFEEEYSVYKNIPEFHPNYESHYSDFLSKQNENKNEEELEKLFKLDWKWNYESIKNSDWKNKQQILITTFTSKVKSTKVEDKLKLRKQHQQDKGATNKNYFDFEQGLALLESVCDKIKILGSAVKEMISASRAFGNNSSESYKVFTEPENVAMLYMVANKLKDMSKAASNEVLRILYDEALDCIPKLLELAKKGPSYNKESDQKSMIDSLDLEAIAKVSADKGSEFTRDIINAALSYEGIHNPPAEVIKSIFVKVSKIHLTMVKTM